MESQSLYSKEQSGGVAGMLQKAQQMGGIVTLVAVVICVIILIILFYSTYTFKANVYDVLAADHVTGDDWDAEGAAQMASAYMSLAFATDLFAALAGIAMVVYGLHQLNTSQSKTTLYIALACGAVLLLVAVIRALYLWYIGSNAVIPGHSDDISATVATSVLDPTTCTFYTMMWWLAIAYLLLGLVGGVCVAVSWWKSRSGK